MKTKHSWSKIVLVSTLAISLSLISGVSESQTCVSPPTGLVAWWPGEDNKDIVGGNDLILHGNAVFGSGFVGQAFEFGTAFDFATSVSNIAISGAQPRTVDAWVKVRNFTNVFNFIQPAVSWGSCSVRNLNVLGFRNQSLFFWGHNADLQGAPKSLNQWYHVAMTFDGSLAKLYVNGIVEVSGNLPLNTTDTIVTLGGDYAFCGGSTVGFDGFIDEIEIFNRELSAAEIQSIYNAGTAGKCKTLDVVIDIKPGSDPNCFNNNGHGVIPVAILGSEDLDVAYIDTSTLLLDGFAVRVRGNNHPLCSVEYSDIDAFPDLVCKFEDEAPWNWAEGDETATVTGALYDGTHIEGTDSICIVPSGSASN